MVLLCVSVFPFFRRLREFSCLYISTRWRGTEGLWCIIANWKKWRFHTKLKSFLVESLQGEYSLSSAMETKNLWNIKNQKRLWIVHILCDMPYPKWITHNISFNVHSNTETEVLFLFSLDLNYLKAKSYSQPIIQLSASNMEKALSNNGVNGHIIWFVKCIRKKSRIIKQLAIW